VRQFGILDGGEAMNMTRWLMIAALGWLSSTLAHADTVAGHYEIILTDFNDNEEFNFNPNVPVPGGLDSCYPPGSICGDPSFGLDAGGKSTPESGEYSFSSGATGSTTLDYQNTGAPITSVDISTTYSTDSPTPPPLECYSDIFADCGFSVTDSPTVYTINAYFYNPYAGGIATAVPEPSQWIILSLAFAGVIVARARKGTASSSFAQTQRSVCPARD
jgi:hypothetical protein